MASDRDQMIAWCLEELRKAGTEGIPIFVLFNKLDIAHHSPGAEAKSQVWEALVAKADVSVGEDDGHKSLSQSTVGQLTFEHVLTTSHGGRVIRVESPQAFDPSTLKSLEPETFIEVHEPAATSAPKRKASVEAHEPPAPKRRGRPPKVRVDGVEPKRRPTGGPRGRPKSSSRVLSLQPELPPEVAPSPLQSYADQQSPPQIEATLAIKDQLNQQSVAILSTTSKPPPNDDGGFQGTSPQAVSVLQDSGAIASSISSSIPIELAGGHTLEKRNEFIQREGVLLPNGLSAVKDSQPEALAVTTVSSIEVDERLGSKDHDRATVLELESPKSSQVAIPADVNVPNLLQDHLTLELDIDGPSIVVEVEQNRPTNSNIAVHAENSPKKNTRRTTKARRSISPILPEGIYTSQADLDREEGLPGVYIDPAGSQRRDLPSAKGRPAKARIAVFKSDKLKDPHWLENRRGTWIEVSAERLASRLIQVEDEAQPPLKRGKRKRQESIEGGTPKKAKKTKNSTMTGDSDISQALASSALSSELLLHEIQGKDNVSLQSPNPDTAVASVEIPTSAAQQSEVGTATCVRDVISETSLAPARASVSSTSRGHGDVNRTTTQNTTAAPAQDQILQQTSQSSLQQPGLENVESQNSIAADGPSSMSLYGAREDFVKNSSSLSEHFSTAQRSYLNSPYTSLMSRQPPAPRSHRIAHPFDPSQEIIVQKPAVENHGCEHRNVSTSSPRQYVSPFAPITSPAVTNSYQSPYATSTYTSQYQQPQHLNAPFATPAMTNHQQRQWSPPGNSMSSPSKVTPKPSSSRSRSQNAKTSSKSNMTEHQSQMSGQHHPQSSKGMLEFHHRYSAMYTPNRQVQIQQPPQQQPAQESSPHDAVHIQPSTTFQTQESWPSEISSQPQTELIGAQPMPNLIQHETPPILDDMMASNLSQSKDSDVLNSSHKEDKSFTRNGVIAIEVAESQKDANEASIEPPPQDPTSSMRAESFLNDETMVSGGVERTTQILVSQPKRKYTRKPKGDEQEVTDEVGPLLSPAEAVDIPEGATRLACIFEGVAGNLLLQKDMSALNFFETAQSLSETPKFTLTIARISQNPITSMPGSRRMELRVKSKDDDELDVTHCFLFAPRSSSSEAASSMRAKIVTAMIAYRFRSGTKYDRPDEVEIQHKKKYVCEKCDSRFKNINGLQYHQTKSASVCNPNYVPKAPVLVPPKAQKSQKAPKTKRTPGVQRKSMPRKNLRKLEEDEDHNVDPGVDNDDVEMAVDTPEQSDGKVVSSRSSDYMDPDTPRSPNSRNDAVADNDGNASDGSEDSFIEWAKRHTTTGVERVPKKPDMPVNDKPKNPLRLYKALNNETDVLKGIITEIMAASKAQPEQSTQVSIDTPLSQIAAQLLPEHPADTMTDTLCEEILLAVIRANDGMFPADRGLWFACTAVWLSMHALPTSLPRSTLPSKALDSLLQDQKIEKMSFTYQDKRKRHIMRSIVYLPGTDSKSSKMDAMKAHIQETTPGYYVPSGFAPPPMVFKTLQALASRAILKQNMLQKNDDVQLQSIEVESTDDDDVDLESSTAPTPTGDPFDDEDDDDEFIDNADPAVESESDLEAEMDGTSSESEGDLLLKGQPHKRKRSEKHNAAISEGLRRRWDDVRAGGDNPFQRGQDLINQPRRTRGVAARLSQEEKDRRAHTAALRQQSWGNASAFMPNPDTGAWNQKPLKTKGKYNNRRLPEPVTYLQDISTGAWSVRPFGHGVLPIFSRPARRADGNPLAGQYLKRVQNSFRPIVFPKKNRMFLPGPPSKALRESISRQNEPSIESTTSKRETRKRATLRHVVEPEDDEATKRRISLATGKPVRVYRRKNDTPEDEVPSEGELKDAIDLLDMFGNTNKQNVRSKAQKATFVSEVEILNFFEPKKLPLGGKLNPGLETLPPSFGLDPALYRETEEAHDYRQEKLLNFRTPRNVDCMSRDPNYASWTMDSLKMLKDPNYKLRWDEQTAFTLETLPYGQLDDDSTPSLLDIDLAPPPKRQRVSQGSKWNHSRLLTTHATDFAGIFEDPYEAIEEFDIQMGGSINQGRKRRQQKQGSTMSPLVEGKFLVAVIMVRTLTGGLDNLVDWVIVNSLFPEMSIDYMRRQFTTLQKTKDLIIERLVVDFQHSFLKAYERGELDPLDYDDLPGYDWQKLLNWAAKIVDTQVGSKSISLPDTREEFYDQYNAVILDRDEAGWRELFYASGAAVYKRIEATAAEPHSVPLVTFQNRSTDEMTKLLVAKSLLRAIAVTPEKDYLASVAKARMDELGKSLANEAFDALVADKTIMHRNRHRATIGRGYEVTEPFFRPLNKYLKDVQFLQAVQYKHWLDEQFINGATCVRADYLADEGSIMCMTSLHAHGRIRLVAIDVPMDKFGLTEGGYETRQIPRERLRFEMDIYPTTTYLYDFDNTVVNHAVNTSPPAGSDKGEVPLWFGITGRVITDLWTKVLMSVGSVLAFRAGTDMTYLRKVFRSTMEEWELRMLLSWGEEMGFFVTIGDQGGAWTVGEWWWLIAGKSCSVDAGDSLMTGV